MDFLVYVKHKSLKKRFLVSVKNKLYTPCLTIVIISLFLVYVKQES